jgi:hypothetical protein
MFMDERYVAVPWMAKSDACSWMNGILQGARKAVHKKPATPVYSILIICNPYHPG